jgi:xylulokinase
VTTHQAGDAVLAIDVGTTQVKTAIVDAAGLVVWDARQRHALMSPQPGWAEQDAEGWWRLICTSLQSAPAETLSRLAAVCVTGHNPTLVCVGRDGIPRRSAITWADSRAVAEARTLSARVGRPVDASSNVSKATWLRTHEPEVLADGRLLQSFDYIGYELTDTFVATSAIPGWPAWDAAIFDASGLDPALLPPPGPRIGSIMGEVSATAARATGLQPGLPVVVGLVDGLASWIGTRTLDHGELYAGAGTSAGANLCWNTRLDDPRRRIFSLPHPLGGRFMPGGPMSSGSRFLDWLAQDVCRADISTLIAEARSVPPGANGLLALPYLTGERTPMSDPLARGVFIGLDGRHSRAHMARAALEAVAFALRDVMEVMIELGANVTVVRVGGGGAASDTWNQIKADVLGRPVIVPRVRDASMMGAAVVAAWGAGFYATGDDAARAMVHLSATFDPQPTPLYDEMFARFRGVYGSLRDEFAALSRVGAPA